MSWSFWFFPSSVILRFDTVESTHWQRTGSCSPVGEGIYGTGTEPSNMTSPLFSRFGTGWLLSCSQQWNFAEGDAFLIVRGAPAMYGTRAEGLIKMCVPGIVPAVAENNSFVNSCQKGLLWRGPQELTGKRNFTFLESHSSHFIATPRIVLGS
jgi:hypothetical protein